MAENWPICGIPLATISGHSLAQFAPSTKKLLLPEVGDLLHRWQQEHETCNRNGHHETAAGTREPSFENDRGNTAPGAVGTRQYHAIRTASSTATHRFCAAKKAPLRSTTAKGLPVMTKLPPFDPADLKPIHILHSEGKFPSAMTLRHIRNLCAARQFPSVKIGQQWNTTETAIRAWVWDHANSAFKHMTS
jgi:hypothetical protein